MLPLFAPVEEYVKSILRIAADEAYWFSWRSSFHGEATIQLARVDNEAVVSRIYPPSKYGKVRRYQAMLTPAEWSWPEDAVVAATLI